MIVTFELVISCIVGLIIIDVLPRSFDEAMEEHNQVCPGIDFPVKCPEKGNHFAKIYYEEDYLNVSNIYHNENIQPLSDNGFYLIKNVSVNDSNDFVCVYKEPEIPPYTIHLMVIAIDPFDYLNHTQVFHFAGTPPIPDAFAVVEENNPLKEAGRLGTGEKEDIIAINDNNLNPLDNSIEAQVEEYVDEPKTMAHDQLGQDYNVGPPVNTTGLVPPSMPKIKRISPSSVEISWSIKPNRGSPVSHFLVQHLTSMSTHGVGGGSFWKYSKKISPSTKWCLVDKLMPKYWYRFRVAAVFHNKGEEIKVFGARSEWLKL